MFYFKTLRMTSIIAFVFKSCGHQNEKNILKEVTRLTTFSDLFNIHHTEFTETWNVKVNEFHASNDSPVWSAVEAVPGTGPPRVVFTCSPQLTTSNAVDSKIKSGPSAFDVLMASAARKIRVLPPKKTTSRGSGMKLSSKDVLFNDIIDSFQELHLDFNTEAEGTYVIQVLCNTLWYLTNQHETINEAALHRKGVLPIPLPFSKYTGYNDVKRKKQKELPLSANLLNGHSQTLYTLLMRPVFALPSWKEAANDIKSLAQCLIAYHDYLKTQCLIVSNNQAMDHPVRQIDNHATIDHRQALYNESYVKQKYKKLDDVLKSRDILSPLLFDEALHCDNHFETSDSRYKFFQNLQLSVPIDIIKFCPGGSIVTTVCIIRVAEERTESEILTQGGSSLQKVKSFLLEYHTRAQKQAFRKKLANVAHVLPSVADMIYSYLALDASTASHPVTQERLRLIFLGHEGLLVDLRSLNAGRPSTTFDVFFEKMGEIVEQVTAADERRHNIAHLSEWISMSELISQTTANCPEDTPVPSKSLVRLQFAPRNPYSHAALAFTSRIQVQYKIQTRQLRSSHPDEHYCAAQFKYLREKAIELKTENCNLFFCDDKAKVPVGSPNCPVSTGVRGKKTIAPSTTSFGALDHDMTKCSLTPSVFLKCEIPENIEKSFLRGQVTTVVNDSVFQQSSPFRHGASIIKMIDPSVNILMKFTDGGTDQRNNLESVKCATICIFLELNLDMVILCRCAPGQSWLNPAERVMSILNLALQNCALERLKGDEKTESQLKKCNSMKEIRSLAQKSPDIQKDWVPLIEPVQSLLLKRFSRLALKDKPFNALDPVTDDEINNLKRHLIEKFPDLDLEKLTKADTSKCQSYKNWISQHCRERHYCFQVRKCENENCCLPAVLPREELKWLPDPVLADDGEHYKPYASVKGLNTTENDRPSLKAANSKKTKTTLSRNKRPHPDLETVPQTEPQASGSGPNHHLNALNHVGSIEPVFGEYGICTAQNARSVISCVECRKPRVIYSKSALSETHRVSLAVLMSDSLYTCGAPLTPPDSSLHAKLMVRANLQCHMSIEVPYYSSTLGRKDLCSNCAAPNSIVCMEQKKMYKTVLPLCDSCRADGVLPFVARPYGRKKKA